MGSEIPEKKLKLLAQIDEIHNILKKLLSLGLLAVLIGMFCSTLARAASIPDIFLVPIVRLTPIGAAVLQPQTGDGYNMLFTRDRVYTESNTSGSVANSTISEAGSKSDFSNGSNYIAPQYDAFSEDSMKKTVAVPTPVIKNIDTVDFAVRNNLSGSIDQTMGTTSTIFTFSADISSKDFKRGEMEYRWDFENDGEMDSYFSRVKTITHRFETAGEYHVKLEVLDSNGLVSTISKTVYIVENEAPIANFNVNAVSVPENSIIKFDTSFSSDGQYSRNQLEFRFDWNGDGQYDTNYQNKTVWNHLFQQPGKYHVIMQVRDPEGLTSRAQIDLTVSDDNPPAALLSVESLSSGGFKFDASHSTDDFTTVNHLKFRWDLNYTGPNDIVFDSNWSNTPYFTANYKVAGRKTIRLQVMDEQGFRDETFAKINVPWTQDYLNLAVDTITSK